MNVPTGNVQAGEVKEIPFEQIRNKIDDNMSVLAKKLGNLYNRLESVLNPSVPVPEKCVESNIKAEENSKIISWMRFTNNNIEGYISGINDIISRLEI